MRENHINGSIFQTMLISGLNNIRNHEKEINAMNVFPVADGDTGTNMCLTLENGVRCAKEEKHLGKYLKEVSTGMLFGARGNSGVILSQLFLGIYNELKSCGIANPNELRNAFVSAYRTAYRSVVRPVEGTILTVAREGAENLRTYRGITIDELFCLYVGQMKESLNRTPEILPVLKEAGVLDSGGMGYITIVEGMAKALMGESVELNVTPVKTLPAVNEQNIDFDENSEFNLGYCTEFLLQLMNSKTDVHAFSLEDFIKELEKSGNSLAVTRAGTVVKVHIHTFEPAKVIALANSYGEFITFKLENMEVQHSGLNKPKKKIGIVSVAEGDGIVSLIKESGSDIIINGGITSNPSAEEFINAFNEVNAENIVVFPNNSNIIKAAEQAAELSKNGKITVIPTRSFIEGYYALIMGTSDIEDVSARIEAMKNGAAEVKCAAVARSVKDYTGTDFSCKKGDFIGFADNKLVSSSQDIAQTLISAMQKLDGISEGYSVCVITGENFDGAEEDALREKIESAFPDMEVNFFPGGQKVYNLLVGVM